MRNNAVVHFSPHRAVICYRTPEIMGLWCESSFMVACGALPAASSYSLTGRVGSPPTSPGSNPRHSWPLHWRGSSLEPTRIDDIQQRKRVLLNMTNGPEIGESGGGEYDTFPPLHVTWSCFIVWTSRSHVSWQSFVGRHYQKRTPGSMFRVLEQLSMRLIVGGFTNISFLAICSSPCAISHTCSAIP